MGSEFIRLHRMFARHRQFVGLEMAEIAAYRDTGEVEVLTFAEGAERMRSAIRNAY